MLILILKIIIDVILKILNQTTDY